VIDLPPLLLALPGVFAMLIYAAKRLFALDLDLLAHREEARLRYLQAQRRSRLHAEEEQPITLPQPDPSGSLIPVEARPHYASARTLPRPPLAGTEHPETFPQQDPFGAPPRRPPPRSKGFFRSRVLNLQRRPPVKADVPIWALALLDEQDAKRYAQEWAAHLHQRVDDGEFREAKIDRQRLARRAIIMALTSRIRKARGADQRRHG
jgi:hypothetical protein